MVHVVIGLRMEIVKYMQSHFFSFSTSCVTSFCSRMRFTSSSIVFSALMIQWAAFTCPLLSRLLPLAPAWSSRRKDCVELASQHKIDHHCGDGRGCVALGWEKQKDAMKEKALLWSLRTLCICMSSHIYISDAHLYCNISLEHLGCVALGQKQKKG